MKRLLFLFTVLLPLLVHGAANTNIINASYDRSNGRFVLPTNASFGSLSVTGSVTVTNKFTLLGGQVISGIVSNIAGLPRDDASLTIVRSNGHAMIDIYNSGTGVSGGEESVVNFSAKDAGGNILQLGSVSMIWADATAGSARSMLRMHGNHDGGSSNSDYRQTADGGIELFGNSDTSWPGERVFQITNGSLKLVGAGVPGLASIYNNGNRLIFNADTSGFLFQKSDNSATILSMTDALLSTFGGPVVATSLKVTGGSSANSTIYKNGTWLTFQCDTSGYLFQNSTSTVSLLTMTDAGVSTFSGGVTALSLKVTGGDAAISSIHNNGNRVIFQGDTGGYLFQNSAATVTLLQITDAGVATFSGNVNSRTNIGTLDVTTNIFVLGTRYTNSNRRLFVSASVTLTAAAAGTATVALYVENLGSATNSMAVSAGPLASLVTTEPLFLPVGPGMIYYFADETSGVGASATILGNRCSRIEW